MRVMVCPWKEIPTEIFPPASELNPDIEFVPYGSDECDLLIVFDEKQLKIDVKCPDNAAWLLAYEPPVACYAHFKDNYKYYDLIQSEWDDIAPEFSGKIIHELYPQLWCLDKSFADLKSITVSDCRNKQDRVSAIISIANNLSGHKFRREFIEFLKTKGLDFDHYGSGHNYLPEKFDGLFPYKYSIGMENSVVPNYCSDKISDCFLALTMPIYYGCPNILNYFPEESMILIDPNDFQASLEMIEEAVATDRWSKNIEALVHARDLVLNKYSIYPYLCNLIGKYYNPTSEPKRKFIPRLLAPKERKLTYKLKKALGIYRVKDYLKQRKLHKTGG